MTDQPNQDLPPAKRRRLIIAAVLRGLVVTTVLVVLHYLLPKIRHRRRRRPGRQVTPSPAPGALAAFTVRATRALFSASPREL